jgi:hypothetical protein
MTIKGFSFERLFSMPSFEGARIIRNQITQSSNLSVTEAVAVIRKIELDVSALDLEASEALIGLLPTDLPNDGAHFYRGCIRQLLLAYQPVWARTMLQGRSRFYSTLERDEQSLFRQTGILEEPPDDAFVVWWDALNGAVRADRNAVLLERGREAERLTIAHEIQRLQREGIDARPRWTGLDDNTKGYDVTSYESREGTLVNRLIEVKSTVASPMRFIVTRNEWDQAEKFGASYLFHIWDISKNPPVLHIRTVDQVRIHIPSDNERGRWKEAVIPLALA